MLPFLGGKVKHATHLLSDWSEFRKPLTISFVGVQRREEVGKLFAKTWRKIQEVYLQSQTKVLGCLTSSPLPPLSNVENYRFFSLLIPKTAIFFNIDLGGGLYVKCPNYFCLKLYKENIQGIF